MLAGGASAETVIVPCAADNTLIESATGALSNGSGPAVFVGRNSQAHGSRRRALLRFDVAGAVPSGVIVTRAELILMLTPSNPQAAHRDRTAPRARGLGRGSIDGERRRRRSGGPG